MRISRFLPSILVLISAIYLSAQEGDLPSPPPYGGRAAINLVLPGSAQIATGKTLEGWLYLGSSASFMGGSLYFAFLSNARYDLDSAIKGRSVENFLSGLCLSAGFAVSAYSSWSFYEDWQRLLEPSRGKPLSFPAVLSSPFLPSVVLSPETLAPLSLTAVCIALALNEDAWFDYWDAQSVEVFTGYGMSPGAAFAVRTAGSALGSLFIVAGTELLYRGLIREREGPQLAFLLDSGTALAGFIAPGTTSGQSTAMLAQRVAWAAYAEILAKRNNGMSRGAIAAGFWMRTLLLATEYIVSPATAEPLRLKFKLSFE